MRRTRIKICGITRLQDGLSAAELGVDALGFVFYPASPRFVEPVLACEIVKRLPPFVVRVGLFVNPPSEFVRHVLSCVALDVLQFHGDEDPDFCARFRRPYIKAARMRPGLDLLQYASIHSGAQALLLDSYVEAYGGGGNTFDWSLIPIGVPRPFVLSGGLHESNVTDAVRRVRPLAVDVSSGVEVAKGIKDAARMAAFIAGVRNADV